MVVMSIGFFTRMALADDVMLSTHVPYGEGMCEACHELDGTGNPIADKFVDTQPNMCYQCHDSKTTGKNVHPALVGDNCTSMCHTPHESKNRSLLQQKPRVLCTSCHDAPGLDQANKHSAVNMVKSCVRCHNPHSTDLPKLLRDETKVLCVYCHKDKGVKIADPAYNKHAALDMGCESCHQPHGAPNKRLMLKPLNDMCFECHDADAFKGGHPYPGHPVSAAADPIYPEKPFSCISCHNPHFSKNEKLFRYNTKKVETPYGGAVCAVCHWSLYNPPPMPPRPKWEQ